MCVCGGGLLRSVQGELTGPGDTGDFGWAGAMGDENLYRDAGPMAVSLLLANSKQCFEFSVCL